MRYNIVLLPKKITFNYVTSLLFMESNELHLCYFLNMSRAWLFVFNIISYIYSKYKSLSHQKV